VDALHLGVGDRAFLAAWRLSAEQSCETKEERNEFHSWRIARYDESIVPLDPTQRFSSRVENYERYRPSYPRGILEILAVECGLTPQSQIADIGSGTGLLSALFLDFGCEVTGVEPNLEMRRAGERALADRPGFRSVDGRAEATTLADDCVDLVTAGQAFHWFDPVAAREEFRRILRPGGCVVLVWNERAPAPGAMDGYEDLVRRYGPERPRMQAHDFDGFFGHSSWRLRKLHNEQNLDFEGLRGRFLSSSYAPLPGAPEYEPVIAELRQLFAAYQKNGRIRLSYDTELYFGRPADEAPPRATLS
jgi:SAM-dependent methyltransferase